MCQSPPILSSSPQRRQDEGRDTATLMQAGLPHRDKQLDGYNARHVGSALNTTDQLTQRGHTGSATVRIRPRASSTSTRVGSRAEQGATSSNGANCVCITMVAERSEGVGASTQGTPRKTRTHTQHAPMAPDAQTTRARHGNRDTHPHTCRPLPANWCTRRPSAALSYLPAAPSRTPLAQRR